MAKSRRLLRNAIFAILVLALIGAIGWFAGPSGTAYGVEFSPDTFSHRSFRYYQWCGIQISTKETYEWRSKVDEYIHANGYAAEPTTATPRWHFVKGMAPGIRGWSGEAKIMCKAVGCWGDSDHWIEWSKGHPDLAAVVWPQVVTWARDRQYHKVAYLLRVTDLETAEDINQVREMIQAANS